MSGNPHVTGPHVTGPHSTGPHSTGPLRAGQPYPPSGPGPLIAGQLGTWGLASLLLLRLAVGWHFFQEGSKKLTNSDFSATPFLQEATGPFAKSYHNLVQDRLGQVRLDSNARIERWRAFGKSFSVVAKLDEAGQKGAADALDRHEKQLADYFRTRAADLEELKSDISRLEAYDHDPRSIPEFEKGWRKKRWRETQTDLAGWYKDLKLMDSSLEHSLMALAPADAKNLPHLPRVAEGKTWVEGSVAWTDLLVGALLLLGLFVPMVSLIGAAFLLSVMATQPYWVPDATLTYAFYQAVEIAALLVLAATSAGRIAGLDYFLATFWKQRREGAQSQAYVS